MEVTGGGGAEHARPERSKLPATEYPGLGTEYSDLVSFVEPCVGRLRIDLHPESADKV
jgi:hypothetical protein